MSRFPGNKDFAFTILDDTDLSTVDNIKPIYSLLANLGMQTTKSVWPLASVEHGRLGGSSLQEPEYRRFVLDLKDRGFEISLHNVRNHHSTREVVKEGLDEYRRVVGTNPRVHANHSTNRENIYWGSARFTSMRTLYKVGRLLHPKYAFEGHNPDTPYFWGDLCRGTIEYVRNFVFQEVNLDRINPMMPYHDPSRPYVNYWFSSCAGANAPSFCETLSEANQDRLVEEKGVCIMYAHLACGFAEDGKVHGRTEQLLRRLATRNGWFVPVSTLLDFLKSEKSCTDISAGELASMEHRWTLDKAKNLVPRVFRSQKA